VDAVHGCHPVLNLLALLLIRVVDAPCTDRKMQFDIGLKRSLSHTRVKGQRLSQNWVSAFENPIFYTVQWGGTVGESWLIPFFESFEKQKATISRTRRRAKERMLCKPCSGAPFKRLVKTHAPIYRLTNNIDKTAHTVCSYHKESESWQGDFEHTS
jgi:hypothetical protein